MKNFKEQYEGIFNIVCRFLGGGWRVNQLDTVNKHRIKLTSPDFRDYAVYVRLEKDRIHIGGGVNSKLYQGGYNSCTVSPTKEPWLIANDIKRKIIFNAEEYIGYAKVARESNKDDQDEKELVKGLLSRLVEISSHWGVLCGFKHGALCGTVEQRYSGSYMLKIDSLDKDKLVRIVGFLSTL
ncbi:TPA: hypothetical protein ACSTJY_004975 [Serratia fonticola]